MLWIVHFGHEDTSRLNSLAFGPYKDDISYRKVNDDSRLFSGIQSGFTFPQLS